MTNVLKKVSPVLAAILFFSASLLAQDQNTTTQQQDAVQQGNQNLQSSATELVDNLATKITLNDEQKKEISDAVVQFQASALNSNSQSGAAGSESSHGTEGSTGTEGSAGTQGSEGSAGSAGTEQGSSDMGAQSGSVSGNSAYTEEWLNSEIESVLDDTQKTQWETVKADFWNQLRDKVATMQQNGMY